MKVDTPPTYNDSLAGSYSTQTSAQITPLGSPIQRVTYPAPSEDMALLPPSPFLEQASSTHTFNHGREPEDFTFQRNSPVFNSHHSQQQYTNLPLEEVRCSLLPTRAAVWSSEAANLRLSTLAATILLKNHILSPKDLQPYIPDQISSDGPSDPLSGILAATHSTVGSIVMGVVDYPLEISRMVKQDRPVATGMAVDFALDSGKGVSRIVGAGLKAPMEFTLGLSRGFHNTPKLYGDEVRKEEKVTGIWSGMKAGGKGLGYGLFDGISGIVMQPVKGAKKDGILGGIKGFGKGIGGVVCKPAAGAIGLPAQAFKGIYEEIQKKRGLGEFQKDEFMVANLLAQGEEEWKVSTEQDRKLVVEGWMEATGEAEKRGGVKYQ